MSGLASADFAEFDAALAVAARDNLAVFAQYVLRNESPGAVGLADGEEWSAESLADINRAFTGLEGDEEDEQDLIELQPYHLDLLDAYRKGQFLSVVAHTESGKTQLAIAYILWRLGRNRRTRVAVVSEGSRLAMIICRTIARYIGDESFSGCKALRRVFPNLRPGPRWGDEFYGVDRPSQIKDPSFAAFGEDAGITGIRADIILCDDLVTPKTTETPHRRKKLVSSFDRKIQNRKTGKGQVINQCNAQWSDDLSAHIESRGYVAHRMMVTKDGTPEGELQWPGKWTRTLISSSIQMNPDWKAMLFAERRQVGEFGRFKLEAIKAALRAGAGLLLGVPIQSYRPGSRICIGIDFAFGGADKCAIAVILVEPPNPGDVLGRRVLLDLAAGKWSEVELVDELKRIVARYPEEITQIRGESNAAQKWIVGQLSRQIGRMIQPYRTSGSKWDANSGIPALAASFDNGLWVMPGDQFGNASGEVQTLVTELLAFDPSKAGSRSAIDHTGDRLMALFFADGLARETRHFERHGGMLAEPIPPEGGFFDVDPDPEVADVTPPAPTPEGDPPPPKPPPRPRPMPPSEPASSWSLGELTGSPGAFGGW